MKILIVTDVYYDFVCGSTYAIRRLATTFKKRGHDVLVIAPSRSIRHASYVYDQIPIYGIRSFPVIVQKGLRLSPPFFIKKPLRKVIQEFAPDVIHAHGHFFIEKKVLSVALKLHIPTIGTNHFMPENVFHHFHLPKAFAPMLQHIGWKQMHATFMKFDIVTTPTNIAAALLRATGFKKPVLAISNGIDLNLFHRSAKPLDIYTQYRIPKKPLLLYVGRLDPEKNIEVLIKAMPHILKKKPAQLVIVGRGSKDKSLRQLAHKLRVEKNVTFAGFVPDKDLPSFYQHALCFMIAGTAELQSLVTMEAMAMGLPILSVNATALPELVADGENGFLFPPGDSVTLAERAIRLLSNPKLCKEFGLESIARIQKHDSRVIAERFEQLYREAIASHRNKKRPQKKRRLLHALTSLRFSL